MKDNLHFFLPQMKDNLNLFQIEDKLNILFIVLYYPPIETSEIDSQQDKTCGQAEWSLPMWIRQGNSTCLLL
jgi:hypothetical protein